MRTSRGSAIWWAALFVLITLLIHLNRSTRAHLEARRVSVAKAGELHADASLKSREALVYNLRSMLHLFHGAALHKNASLLLNRTEQEDEEWENSEVRLEDFQALFDEASRELDALRNREAADQEEIEKAEARARVYLDEISSIQGEYGQFCRDHPRLVMCDAAAKWAANWAASGSKTAALFLKADEQEKTALSFMADESATVAQEEKVQKNVTELAALVQRSEEDEKELHEAYQTDAMMTKELESNASLLMNRSRTERHNALQAMDEASHFQDEAQGCTKNEHAQTVAASFSTLLGLVLALGLLSILLETSMNLYFFGNVKLPDRAPSDQEDGEKMRLMVNRGSEMDSGTDAGSFVDVELQSTSTQASSTTSALCRWADGSGHLAGVLTACALIVTAFQLVCKSLPAAGEIWPRFPTRILFGSLVVLAVYRAVKSARDTRNQLLCP